MLRAPHSSRNRWLSRLASAVGLMLMALSQTGCDQIFQNSRARALETAERKARDGDYRAAVQSYEAALDGSPRSADAHYRLALLYDDKLKSPVSAMHHFQRYLDLSPRGARAKDARDSLKAGEQKLVNSL